MSKFKRGDSVEITSSPYDNVMPGETGIIERGWKVKYGPMAYCWFYWITGPAHNAFNSYELRPAWRS